MIRSFRCGETERLFCRLRSRRFPPGIQVPALRKLRMLDAAETIDELRSPPGNRLERLRGDREGQWSVRVNEQWRVCFVWEEGGARAVEIVDYHKG